MGSFTVDMPLSSTFMLVSIGMILLNKQLAKLKKFKKRHLIGQLKFLELKETLVGVEKLGCSVNNYKLLFPY